MIETNVLLLHSCLLSKRTKLKKAKQTWLRELKPEINEEKAKYQEAVQEFRSQPRTTVSHSTERTYNCAPATTLVISVTSSIGGTPENYWQLNVQLKKKKRKKDKFGHQEAWVLYFPKYKIYFPEIYY